MYPDAMMHFPPEAAVFLVSQLTTSPASSLWKVYEVVSRAVAFWGGLCRRTYDGGCGVPVMVGPDLGRVVGDDVHCFDFEPRQHLQSRIRTILPSMLPFLSCRPWRLAT